MEKIYLSSTTDATSLIVSSILFLFVGAYLLYQRQYYAGIVCRIAFANYIALIDNIGVFVSSSAKTDYLPRYLDWILTTPLLVCMLLQHYMITDVTTYITAIFLDVLMVYTGFLALTVPTPDQMYTLFAMSTFFFVVLVVFVASRLQISSRKDHPSFLLAIYLFGLWAIYPVVWILYQLDFIDQQNYVNAMSTLDVLSKIGFGLWIQELTGK